MKADSGTRALLLNQDTRRQGLSLMAGVIILGSLPLVPIGRGSPVGRVMFFSRCT